MGGIAATAEPKNGPRATMTAPAALAAPIAPPARAHTAAEKIVPAASARPSAHRMTRLRPHAIERRPQNWLRTVTASAASDTAAPTIHSGRDSARDRGAIDTLSMFCAVYVNRAIATRARSVGLVSNGEEGTVHPTTRPREMRGAEPGTGDRSGELEETASAEPRWSPSSERPRRSRASRCRYAPRHVATGRDPGRGHTRRSSPAGRSRPRPGPGRR